MKYAPSILFLFLFTVFGATADAPPTPHTVYDPSPNHLWNRLNQSLFIRTAPDGRQYGTNELDIMYWDMTTNLLSGASHQEALAILDEFINTHGEKLIQDPLKKALLQRDLWALFDWSVRMENWRYKPEREELQKRLAVVIQRLEMTTNEIAALPDNYIAAEDDGLHDLPNGLFQTNSGWINIRNFNANLTAPAHEIGFSGHSIFFVFFRDADGRKAGLDYLKQLNAISPRFVSMSDSDPLKGLLPLNPALPQFPINSQWALVRHMCVIDVDGRIRPTHVTEGIQVRTYLKIERVYGTPDLNGDQPPQHFDEFRMSRDMHASLYHLAADQKDFVSNYFPAGFEPFEWLPPDQINLDQRIRILAECSGCHSDPGIYSVNSFTSFLSGTPLPQTTQLAEDGSDYEATQITSWKNTQSNWRLLQSLWIQTQ
jgi:hypothetical protein